MSGGVSYNYKNPAVNRMTEAAESFAVNADNQYLAATKVLQTAGLSDVVNRVSERQNYSVFVGSNNTDVMQALKEDVSVAVRGHVSQGEEERVIRIVNDMLELQRAPSITAKNDLSILGKGVVGAAVLDAVIGAAGASDADRQEANKQKATAQTALNNAQGELERAKGSGDTAAIKRAEDLVEKKRAELYNATTAA
ncbi:MAG: hypothetical protein ACOX2O_05870 [Bdellovibrionota bacterium]|jgi:hypothetical protein